MTFNSGRAGIVLLTAFAGIACEPAQSRTLPLRSLRRSPRGAGLVTGFQSPACAREKLSRPRSYATGSAFGWPTISGKRWLDYLARRERCYDANAAWPIDEQTRHARDARQVPSVCRPALQLGLGLQIVLALAGLMALAFGPLFFAVASLTGATVMGAREQSAPHAPGAPVRNPCSRRVGHGESKARCSTPSRRMRVFKTSKRCVSSGTTGSRVACAGSSRVPSRRSIRWRATPRRRFASCAGSPRPRVRGRFSGPARPRGHAPSGSTRAPKVGRGSLVRLVALYTTVFALALLLLPASRSLDSSCAPSSSWPVPPIASRAARASCVFRAPGS